MANTRELSQLASLIQIIDQSKSIGITTEYPNAKIGIGTLVPTSKVDVIGGVNVSGAITAASFYGNGSNLSGIATFSRDYNDLTNKPSIPSDTGDLTNNAGFVTSNIIVGLASEGYVDDAVSNKANLSGANFTGIVTATSFVGDGSGLIGVASTDNIVTGTAATFNNIVSINEQLEVNNINVSGTSTISGLTYPTNDGLANQILKTDGSGTLSFVSISSLESSNWDSNQDFGLITDSDTVSDDLGTIGDSVVLSYDLGIVVIGGIIAPSLFVLPSYTVSTLPKAVAGGMIFVTDETGGSIPAFSDGTNWRRVTDRAIVS